MRFVEERRNRLEIKDLRTCRSTCQSVKKKRESNPRMMMVIRPAEYCGKCPKDSSKLRVIVTDSWSWQSRRLNATMKQNDDGA